MISRKELLFQVVLHIVVFLFYSFDRNNPRITWIQVLFFLVYALGVAFITYYLMPKFLYQKKHWRFFGAVALVIIGMVLLEELVLEKIFYPNTRRANVIPGIYYIWFDILPIIAILSGFKFGWDALRKQEQIDALQSTVQESELQFLKSQINPHFLFNNMNNLYSYALEGSSKTPEIILELSGVLRYMLYECKEKFVPLTKEIEQLHNFIKLNKLQIEHRGKIHFDIDHINGNYRIAPLILIVFIENAFKHSQSGQSRDIKIDIRIRQSGATLIFGCKNNHMASQTLDVVAQGIGLQNVQKRLQLLYPDRHKLQIEEGPNSYEVQLTMELEKTETT